jgi:hypothetical protein
MIKSSKYFFISQGLKLSIEGSANFSSSFKTSEHKVTHSSHINADAPAISFFTLSSALPQKEHCGASPSLIAVVILYFFSISFLSSAHSPEETLPLPGITSSINPKFFASCGLKNVSLSNCASTFFILWACVPFVNFVDHFFEL